jgi:hypothetical protein
MKQMVEEIKTRIAKIESEKSAFKMKCLVATDMDDVSWDIVLAADWFESDQMERLNYLSEHIMSDLTIDSISQLNGLVTHAPEDPFIEWLQGVKVLNGSNPHLFLNEVKIVTTESPKAKMIVFL